MQDQGSDRPIRLSAEDARQGRIVLTSTARKAIFGIGLAGFALILLVAALV